MSLANLPNCYSFWFVSHITAYFTHLNADEVFLKEKKSTASNTKKHSRLLGTTIFSLYHINITSLLILFHIVKWIFLIIFFLSLRIQSKFACFYLLCVELSNSSGLLTFGWQNISRHKSRLMTIRLSAIFRYKVTLVIIFMVLTNKLASDSRWLKIRQDFFLFFTRFMLILR